MNSTLATQPVARTPQSMSAESSRLKAVLADGLAAVRGVVRWISPTAKPTDAAIKLATRILRECESAQFRRWIDEALQARALVLDSDAADDIQPGGFTARQIVDAFVDPTALMHFIAGRTK